MFRRLGLNVVQSHQGYATSRRDSLDTAVCGGLTDRKTDEKGRPLATLGFETQRTLMLFDDDAVGDCEPLSGAFADFFSRKEWIEDFLARGFGNARTGIANGDLNLVGVEPSTHREFPH